MKQHLVNSTLVVAEYDEAITFFTQKLNFDLIQDVPLDDGKRWVTIRPKGDGNAGLLLGKAVTDKQKASIGNQTGGRVAFFLNTDDFWRDYTKMKTDGVEFTEEPREEIYATVVVFKDLYGNLWDLLEPRT